MSTLDIIKRILKEEPDQETFNKEIDVVKKKAKGELRNDKGVAAAAVQAVKVTEAKYKTSKYAPSSTASMFHQHLSKLASKVNEDFGTEAQLDMIKTQLHFIMYAAEEVLECVNAGTPMEEWYQNKISKVHGEMEGIHSYMEGRKRHAGMCGSMKESRKQRFDNLVDVAGSKLPPHLAKLFNPDGKLKDPEKQKSFERMIQKTQGHSVKDVTPSGYGPKYEEVEEIDEVSREMLGRYGKKIRDIKDQGGDLSAKRQKGAELAGKKRWGGSGGFEKAKVMATEEYEQIDEISDVAIERYKEKAKQSADELAAKGKHGESLKRRINIMKATAKQVGRTGEKIRQLAKEEVEQLDELSPSTLASYVRGASSSAAHQGRSAGVELGAGGQKRKEKYNEYEDKLEKRLSGIRRAVGKLAKEETEELDEAKADIYHKHMLKALGKTKLPKNHDYTSTIASNGDFVVHNRGDVVARIPKGEHNLKEEIKNLTKEEVDTGEADARKTIPSSKEQQDKVFDKHKERVKKLRKEESTLDEKLHGDQHKIDANKNKRIDSEDFKILRAQKKGKENIEEVNKEMMQMLIRKTAQKHLDKVKKIDIPGVKKAGKNFGVRSTLNPSVQSESVTEGQPGQHKPSKYEYVGKTKDNMHVFKDEDGKKEAFAHRSDAPASWHLKHKGKYYEFAHSIKEDVDQIDEKLDPSMGAGAYVKDFQKSNAPQFKGKTKKEREEMAIAAYLDAKRGMKSESEMIDADEIIAEMVGAGMTVRHVQKHLKKTGWSLARTKGRHDVYTHPKSDKNIAVPRHKGDLSAPTVISIMKASKIDEDINLLESKKSELVKDIMKKKKKKDDFDAEPELKTSLAGLSNMTN